MSDDYFESMWMKYVGSWHISEDDELTRIVFLLNKKTLTFAQARNLFYLTKFWQRLRREALSRDGSKCVQCGSVDNLQVDHIRYRGIGNDRLEDLQTLCFYCHEKKTSKSLMKVHDISYMVKDSDELFTVVRTKREVQNG